MNTASIPATRDDLVTDLTAAGDLLRATGWQLAATVWAWTEPKQGERTSDSSVGSRMSIESFARLRVRGLSSHVSVRRYRRAWQEAVDAGVACTVEPGDKVELPDVTLWSFDGDGHLVDETLPEPDREPSVTPRTHHTPSPASDELNDDGDDAPDDTPEWHGTPLDEDEIERRATIDWIDSVRAKLQVFRARAANDRLRDSDRSHLLAIRKEIDSILEGF